MHRTIQSLLAKARTHVGKGACRPGGSPTLFEALEGREMMSVSIATPLPDATVVGSAPVTIPLAGRYTDPATLNRVRFVTNLGNVDIELNPTAAPNTVANFLAYVNAGRYDGTIFHRLTALSSDGIAVLQGGGFTLPTTGLFSSGAPVTGIPGQVATFAPINLENPTGNLRYTLSMARTNDPNSATSQFFINTADNTSLNAAGTNAGYAVFATVLASSRAVVDQLYTQGSTNPLDNRLNLSGAFAGSPVAGAFTQAPIIRTFNNNYPVNPTDYLSITTATSVVARYTATSGNPSIATAAIVNGQLVVTPAPNGFGPVSITVRATGFANTFVDDTFILNITEVSPTASTLQTRDNRAIGRSLGLYAVGVRDTDRSVTRVDFYRDTNANGSFDEGVDLLLGTDSSAAGGYNARVDTSTFSVGANTLFARIVNSAGLATITTQTVNMLARPTATSITPPASAVNPGQTYSVQIEGVTPASANVRRVSVFLDSNNDGALNPFTDRLLGNAVYNSSTGNWVFTGRASGFETGTNRLFIRVQDIFANLGLPQSTTVTVE
ncbi:MAG: peptidylprolyl isomerase [bacterium]